MTAPPIIIVQPILVGVTVLLDHCARLVVRLRSDALIVVAAQTIIKTSVSAFMVVVHLFNRSPRFLDTAWRTMRGR